MVFYFIQIDEAAFESDSQVDIFSFLARGKKGICTPPSQLKTRKVHVERSYMPRSKVYILRHNKN